MTNLIEIKDILTDSLIHEFPQSNFNQLEAVVTHWIQSPSTEIPFLTKSMREYCELVIQESVKKKKQRYLRSKPNQWTEIPFPPPENTKFTFIDLFAGIGGFRIAMQRQGGKCLFSSEWDTNAKKTYEVNFGEVPFGDIREIPEELIPEHDVLCAGFPCQPFSLAGVSARNSLNTAHGFACETQGTLFFDIARIIKARKPKVVFLENVKNLVRHDQGRTFSTIQKTLESLGYTFSKEIIDSSPLVPQKRVRCYIVCLKDSDNKFEFPEINGPELALKTVLENKVDKSFTISNKLWEGHQRRTRRNINRGTGFTAFCADLNKPSKTIVARYGKDGKECLIPQGKDNPRMLTPRECARLQGFPEKFIIPCAKTTAYRQFGNSVAVPVVEKIAEKIEIYLNK